MKRVLAFFTLLCLLCALPGCGGGLFGDEAGELLLVLTPHYETGAVIRSGTMELTATISHPSPAQCTVSLTAPETVSGMQYLFRQDNVDVLYKDLGFSFDAASMPPAAPVGLTVSALSAMLRTDDAQALRATENGWELTGTVGASPCTMLLDSEGTPLSVQMPDQQLEVELSGFVYLRNETAA